MRCHVRSYLTGRFFRFAVCVFLVLSSRLAHGQTPFNWSGFYIGGNLGSDWLRYHAGNSGDTVTEIVDMNPPATGFISVSGFDRYDTTLIGGGQLGYNFQFGILVVGLEGDFDGISSGGVGKLFTPSPFGPTFNSERTSTELVGIRPSASRRRLETFFVLWDRRGGSH